MMADLFIYIYIACDEEFHPTKRKHLSVHDCDGLRLGLMEDTILKHLYDMEPLSSSCSKNFRFYVKAHLAFKAPGGVNA